MFKKLIHAATLSHFVVTVSIGQSYKLVVYNVEKLFDADGHAVYNDYSPDQYTPAHVNTKMQNMVRLMARFNNGEGPEVILFSEVESDHTPLEGGASYNHAEVLERYQHTTLSQMFGEQFNDGNQ